MDSNTHQLCNLIDFIFVSFEYEFNGFKILLKKKWLWFPTEKTISIILTVPFFSGKEIAIDFLRVCINKLDL